MAETFYNWNKSVESKPTKVKTARNLAELVAIVRTPATCPSPIRVAGNRHSTTACFATTGTQVFLDGEFDTKCELSPNKKTVTVGAGVRMLDIARFLQLHEVQLAVMPEIGNATAGSVACCGTKDSSFDSGPSQISSTVIAVKMVKADGEVESVDARSNPERMRVIRSSYGLLGIIYEVTFETEPLALARYTYDIRSLTPLPSLADLRDGANSVLGFMQPYDNQILVERRTLVDPSTTGPLSPEELAKYTARRWIWRSAAAEIAGSTSGAVEKVSSLQSKILASGATPEIETHFRDFTASTSAAMLHATRVAMVKSVEKGLNDFRGSRADCMVDFPEEGPHFDFTFWAFPVSKWAKIVPKYLEFVNQFAKDTGFQKSLFTEVYLISKDNASSLTFSPDEDVFTLDMVHHEANNEQWKKLNRQYNVFAAEQGGLPLLNQTKELTTSPQVHGKSVVRATLGDRWQKFLDIVRQDDPAGRFMNDFFKNL
jgi:FAD binding domain